MHYTFAYQNYSCEVENSAPDFTLFTALISTHARLFALKTKFVKTKLSFF